MKKRVAAAGLVLGLAGGTAAGLAFSGVPGVAGAQDSTTTTTPSSSSGSGSGSSSASLPSEWITNALAPLVDAGTLTQAQADAVANALREAKPARGPGGGRHGGRGVSLDAAATAIGITPEALREALQSGQTIAQVAEANDKDPQVVIDALVAAAKARLDEAVAAGRITQAEADERLAEQTTRITEKVNSNTALKPSRTPRSDDSTTTTAPSSS